VDIECWRNAFEVSSSDNLEATRQLFEKKEAASSHTHTSVGSQLRSGACSVRW